MFVAGLIGMRGNKVIGRREPAFVERPHDLWRSQPTGQPRYGQSKPNRETSLVGITAHVNLIAQPPGKVSKCNARVNNDTIDTWVQACASRFTRPGVANDH